MLNHKGKSVIEKLSALKSGIKNSFNLGIFNCIIQCQLTVCFLSYMHHVCMNNLNFLQLLHNLLNIQYVYSASDDPLSN